MQNQVVTTGLIPLVFNSTETFQLQAFIGTLRNGVPWDLTGGTVNIKFADPFGNVTSFSATITGKGAQYTWTVPMTVPSGSAAGAWQRAWDVTDATGVRQVSRPIPFVVESSPI